MKDANEENGQLVFSAAVLIDVVVVVVMTKFHGSLTRKERVESGGVEKFWKFVFATVEFCESVKALAWRLAFDTSTVGGHLLFEEAFRFPTSSIRLYHYV